VKALVVYWHPPQVEMREAVRLHLHALDEVAPGSVIYHNAHDPFPIGARRRRYRAVILHNTFLCMRWSTAFTDYLSRIAWIAERPIPKVAIPQDEYDHHEILDEWLSVLGVGHVFTNFGAEERKVLYPTLTGEAVFEEALTGYIDEKMAARARASMRPIDERPYDLVYRASDLPYWFGRQGQLKASIGDSIARPAEAAGLSTNVSARPEDTLYGEAWEDLLLAGKAIAGCETGSSVLDHRGEIQARIQWLLSAEPGLTFEEVDARMPEGWDSYGFFAIGPRHLEAVATRTCQVLVEGHYSGVLEPGRHYLALRRDLSNLDEVVERLRDHRLLGEITETAYRDVYASGRFDLRVFGRALAAAAGLIGAAAL
jgi:hypothetical protein